MPFFLCVIPLLEAWGGIELKNMDIKVQKGQRIEIGLQKVGVGLGWDPNYRQEET